jgi:PTH1 family peptidyl-tRNA hydrolase
VRFVVGLGNPGERYRRTRHNTGFMVVDALAARVGAPPGHQELGAWVRAVEIARSPALLVKPLSYVNASGAPVWRLLGAHGGTPADVVVVVDDVALDLGTVRVRERGSHGGHNGLRSLIEELGTEEFPRVRVGVRRGDLPEDLAAYVLADFPEEDVLVLQEAVGWAADAVTCLLNDGAAAAMSRFNGRRL